MRNNKVVEISIEKLEKFNNMKISIVTAAYNSGKTIRDTLESVLRQTYDNYELIVKDGGSKDNTLDICREYEERFKGRMKIISSPDKGIYDAMNQGVSSASGDIVGILNSDDFYTSDDILERIAGEYNADTYLEALYGDIHFVSPNNLMKCTRYYSSSYFRPWLLRFGFMPAHPSFYVRKAVYDTYGLYDLQFRTSSDFEWMVRLFTKYHIRAKYIHKDFVTMRSGGESTAGMEAKRKVNNDIVASLKKNGIFTCEAFKYIRYAWKGIELLVSRIKY